MKILKIPFVILVCAVVFSFIGHSQSRIYYLGGNYSSIAMSSSQFGQDLSFQPGCQIGYLFGGKSLNILGRSKLLKTYVGVEYCYLNSKDSTVFEEPAKELSLSYHGIKISLPVHLRISPLTAKNWGMYFNVAPGVTYFGIKQVQNTLAPQHGNSGFDFNTVVGLCLRLGRLKDGSEVSKSGYKCSGLVISANRYFSANWLSKIMSDRMSVDQYRLSLGLQFDYVKAKPKKKKRGWFN